MSETTAQSTELEQYTLPDETVKNALVGGDRTFAVTDRRVIDVTQGVTSAGRAVEAVESTLYSGVQKVKVDIQGTTTQTNGTMVLLAVVAGLLGLIALGAGAEEGENGLVVAGLVLLGIAVWLYLNATEDSPGGIAIRFRYVTDDGWVEDTYLLPEDNLETAYAAARAAGTVHGPDTPA